MSAGLAPAGGFTPPRTSPTSDRFAIRGVAVAEKNLFEVIAEYDDGSREIRWPDGATGRWSAAMWYRLRPEERGWDLHDGQVDAEMVRWEVPELRAALAASLIAGARVCLANPNRFAWWCLGFCGEVRS